MYECEIGQGLPGNSVPRAMGGAVQNTTLPASRSHARLRAALTSSGLSSNKLEAQCRGSAVRTELRIGSAAKEAVEVLS